MPIQNGARCGHLMTSRLRLSIKRPPITDELAKNAELAQLNHFETEGKNGAPIRRPDFMTEQKQTRRRSIY
jgi:hypothetical protein